MFSFEICNKAIKQVALSISQVFIAILCLILDFRAGKDRNVIMVTYIKSDVFVLIETLSILFQVSVDRLFKFFQVSEITELSMK